ncbi:hypothetical protein CBR_g46625, partial [Chara braunii]
LLMPERRWSELGCYPVTCNGRSVRPCREIWGLSWEEGEPVANCRGPPGHPMGSGIVLVARRGEKEETTVLQKKGTQGGGGGGGGGKRLCSRVTTNREDGNHEAMAHRPLRLLCGLRNLYFYEHSPVSSFCSECRDDRSGLFLEAIVALHGPSLVLPMLCPCLDTCVPIPN